MHLQTYLKDTAKPCAPNKNIFSVYVNLYGVSGIDFCCSASMPKSQHLPSFTALENVDCQLLLAFYIMSQIAF